MRWIKYRDKRILFHDFSNVTDSETALQAFARSREMIAKCEPRTVLTLTTVANSRFNPEIIAGLKELGIANKPFVRHGAVIGVTGLLKVIFVTVSQLTGRNMMSFDSLEEARDWLVDQD